MSSKSLEELPIRKLYALAKGQHLRVGLTIDGGIGETYLDTLDVWDGRPGVVGSKLVARAVVQDGTVNGAAMEIIDELQND